MISEDLLTATFQIVWYLFIALGFILLLGYIIQYLYPEITMTDQDTARKDLFIAIIAYIIIVLAPIIAGWIAGVR
ncbi:hypothetical protein [Pyrococcus kukulkanii]|uniref:Uncharacterized protein n=1 Tax=Pyrococcus kukulkanii TaxID=1609559 RepID=A0ABV4T5P6_9EURY